MNFFVLMSKYDDIPSWACSDVIDFNSAENVNEILKQIEDQKFMNLEEKLKQLPNEAGVYQYFDVNSATGVGYGGSLEYKITQYVAIEGSYKTTNMRYSTNDYDYNTSNVAIKFNY